MGLGEMWKTLEFRIKKAIECCKQIIEAHSNGRLGDGECKTGAGQLKFQWGPEAGLNTITVILWQRICLLSACVLRTCLKLTLKSCGLISRLHNVEFLI